MRWNFTAHRGGCICLVMYLVAALAGCSHSRSARIDSLVRAHMDDRRIPGVSLAIVTGDGVVMESAYGLAVIQHGVPATVDTVYEIASITKQFTATGVLMLCDEGKLSLDDPIERHLDAAPAKWRGITIRQLLTHTAGLASEDEQFASLRSDWRRYTSRELMLSSAMADPVRSAPGEVFSYGSMNYFLAAMMIESASGMTYREFMQERIFGPLGMDRTLLQDELRIIPNEAQGYSLLNGEHVNIWRDAVEEVAGGWGMFSCVADLVRWDRALREGELLSAESYKEMWTPVEMADGTRFHYGLGWWVPERNGIRYQYHSGITGTEILRIPSHDLTVIVLTNLGRSSMIGSNEANAWGLAEAIAGELIPEFAVRTRDYPLSESELLAYAGRWWFSDDGEAKFFVRDGFLWIEDVAGVDRLYFQGEDTFGIRGDSYRLVFERGEDGGVDSARWVADTWQDEPGKRIDREVVD